MIDLTKLLTIPISPIQAQSSDGISLPTFTTDIDFDTGGGSGGDSGGGDSGGGDSGGGDSGGGDTGGDSGGSTTGKINLKVNVDKTNYSVGDTLTATVDVDSNTGSVEVSSISIELNYNGSVIQAIDSDSATTDFDVEFTNSAFTLTAVNFSSSAGTIEVQAESSTPAVLTGEIFTVDFNVLTNGTPALKIDTADSTIVDDNSANVLGTGQTSTFTIGSSAQTVIESTPTTGVISDTAVPLTGISDLPKSDLPFTGTLTLIFGILLVYLGFKGRQIGEKSRNGR